MMIRSLSCLALCLVLAGCASAPPAPKPSSQGPSFYDRLAASGASVDPVAARDMISIYRRNNGLGGLMIDPALQRAAQAQADAMAAANDPGHNVRGPLPSRLGAQSVQYSVAVENVSAGYHTLAEAFSGWRQSTPHNTNMLKAEARRMGIATAYAPGTKYKVFWALILTD